MEWIVIGEEKGNLKLVSRKGTNGLIPKGAYLTVTDGDAKYILRVINSKQNDVYSPSPLLIDMNIEPLVQDRKCQNIVVAARVKDLSEREDGLIDFIKPLSLARLSNQEEISKALESSKHNGPNVMLSTIHSSRCQVLRDNKQIPITTNLPKSMFFHQIQICGKTGSGKTVASKYLAHHFVKNMNGAVLAVNVKDDDFLRMDQASIAHSESVKNEWEALNLKPSGISNYTIYYPATASMKNTTGISMEKCKKITLDLKTLDPEALSGLIRGISDTGAQNLPNIFRYWKDLRESNGEEITFAAFMSYFNTAADNRVFHTLNSRGDTESEITLHVGTYNNIRRNLDKASDFFDSKDAEVIGAEDVLSRGKMSVINVANSNGVEFGAILLRHLLHRIVELKASRGSDIPILIIIDEVHQFYNNDSSKETLGDLDTICRTGRSQEIGVVFSSQNPNDIPKGLSSVINTKFYFKTDVSGNIPGVEYSKDELANLKAGYAAVAIHDLSQVKSIKMPLSLSGVFEKE